MSDPGQHRPQAAPRPDPAGNGSADGQSSSTPRVNARQQRAWALALDVCRRRFVDYRSAVEIQEQCDIDRGDYVAYMHWLLKALPKVTARDCSEGFDRRLIARAVADLAGLAGVQRVNDHVRRCGACTAYERDLRRACYAFVTGHEPPDDRPATPYIIPRLHANEVSGVRGSGRHVRGEDGSAPTTGSGGSASRGSSTRSHGFTFTPFRAAATGFVTLIAGSLVMSELPPSGDGGPTAVHTLQRHAAEPPKAKADPPATAVAFPSTASTDLSGAAEESSPPPAVAPTSRLAEAVHETPFPAVSTDLPDRLPRVTLAARHAPAADLLEADPPRADRSEADPPGTDRSEADPSAADRSETDPSAADLTADLPEVDLSEHEATMNAARAWALAARQASTGESASAGHQFLAVAEPVADTTIDDGPDARNEPLAQPRSALQSVDRSPIDHAGVVADDLANVQPAFGPMSLTDWRALAAPAKVGVNELRARAAAALQQYADVIAVHAAHATAASSPDSAAAAGIAMPTADASRDAEPGAPQPFPDPAAESAAVDHAPAASQPDDTQDWTTTT